MEDKSQFTAFDRDYYEVDGSNMFEGTLKQINDTLGNLETSPVDSVTRSRKYDQRSKPEVGY